MPSTPTIAIQLLVIAMAWLVAITYLHHYIHIHIELITTVLFLPWLQLAGAVLLVAVLAYLIILSLPGLNAPTLRGFITLSVWIALIVCGHALTHLGAAEANNYFNYLQSSLGFYGILGLAACYALLLAVPFVAGVEIGLLIMAVLGIPGVAIAYGSTIVGLSLAFLVGRRIPNTLLAKGLKGLGFASETVDLDALTAQYSSGQGWTSSLCARLIEYRYLTLAVLLNCPGNAVLGGGGGLAVLSGMSRNVSAGKFFLVIVIATIPVPILILLGLFNIGTFMEHTGLLHDFLTWVKSGFP